MSIIENKNLTKKMPFDLSGLPWLRWNCRWHRRRRRFGCRWRPEKRRRRTPSRWKRKCALVSWHLHLHLHLHGTCTRHYTLHTLHSEHKHRALNTRRESRCERKGLTDWLTDWPAERETDRLTLPGPSAPGASGGLEGRRRRGGTTNSHHDQIQKQNITTPLIAFA